MLDAIVKYLLLFFVGALIGYLIELFYRRFVSQKRWMNPGFLTGPYLPLYGFGTVILYLICNIEIPNASHGVDVLIKSIIILFSMTLIEYIAGLIFIKGMNIKLWDYSNVWGNIQGIICPIYSVFWGIIGFFYYIFIHRFMVDIVDYWSKNQILSFFVGAIFGIFFVDVCITFHLANRIRVFAKEHDVVVHFEVMKSTIKEVPGKIKDRIEKAGLSYRERLEALIKNDNTDDRYAIAGFATSILGFLAFPIGLSARGLKSTKYKKYAIAGLVISVLSMISLFIVALLFVL